MSFFKGYIMTKNKTAAEKFKGVKKFKTLEQVSSLPEYAGILAPDAILIDVDDMQQSNILLKICEDENIRCRILQSRSGMHFLFKNSEIKNCFTKTKVACGLKVDIKSGFKNSYEVLKIDGKERDLIYDILDGEEYQELPKWLFPIKTTMQFLDMETGDGRNDALFKYILVLQASGFSKDEARQTIKIINKYVLKESLSDDELEVVLRDDAFRKDIFFKNNKFQHALFGDYLIRERFIIKTNGQPHLFENGIYVTGQDKIEAAMIQYIKDLSSSKRTEVLKYINLTLLSPDYQKEMAKPNYIAFRNGIYDLDTETLNPFSPDVVITNRIPWDYNPGAYSELADKVLNKLACGDPSIRSLLEECIGSCFYRANTLGKAFILTGEKSNGKSTFIDMIKNLLGTENISALDLKELDQKFQNTALFGKLANLGDDISDEFIVNASVFKKFVTGERVQVQNKGEKPFEFENYAKFIFSANDIPRIKDKTGAVLRRLLIVPFNANFNKDDNDYDRNIKFKLREQEVMEYLIVLGIKALDKVLHNDYTESIKVQQEIDDYKKINNPILGFFDECQIEEFSIENEQTDKVFKRYKEYCLANNYNAMSKSEFSKQICRKLGMVTKVKKIQGKVLRIYIKNN